MQRYATLAILAFVGLAAAGPFLPKGPEAAFRDNLLEELYDTQHPNTDVAHTKELIGQLVEHFDTYDHEDEELTADDLMERKLFHKLSDLSNFSRAKCDKYNFAGIRALVNWYENGGNSPALAAYVTDARDKLQAECAKHSAFSGFKTYLEEALFFLA